jgi:branched-chain amino acid transport system permease protein
MSFPFFFSQLLMGLSSGMLLFLIASGLTIIFGLLGVPNFAHGSLYMFGAYITYAFLANIMESGFFLGLIAATLSLAFIGAFLEFLPIRRIYDRPHALQLLMTFSFILIMEDSAKFLWGTSFKSIQAPAFLSGSIQLPGGREFPTYLMFIIFCGFAVALFLFLIMHKTKLGKIIQAGTSNKEMLGALGINVPRLFTLIFMLGAALAGLAGGLAGPLIGVTAGMGDTIIITVFAIIIVGGVGSLLGAFVCSILVGELNTFGVHLMPGFAMIFTYALVVVVLLTKPEGLFGKGS